MPETVSRRLARFVAGLDAAALPPTVVELAKDRVLDCLATAVAAVGLPVPTVAAAIAGDNTGRATLIGQRRTVPAADAAFVNATLINGRTQDDFLCKSHPGAVSVSAALALAEEEDASGAELIAAVVAGYELTSRAWLGGPTMLPRFRATGVCGAIGAAGAAARILRLDADETAHALGLAALFASGFGAGFLTGTMDVKLNVGMAARNGVTAAILARAGATASDRAFEDDVGYYMAHAGTVEHVVAAVEGLGERFLIEDTLYKEYPVCIFVQTPVALAERLVAREGFAPEDIHRVRLAVPEATYTNPGFRNAPPFANPLKARVSARFCLAAALLGRPVGDFDFYESAEDAEVLALAERIELAAGAQDVQVSLTVETADGRVLSIEGSEGETLRPTRAKVVAKFRRLAGPGLGPQSEPVLHEVLALDRLARVRQLTARLRRPEPALAQAAS